MISPADSPPISIILIEIQSIKLEESEKYLKSIRKCSSHNHGKMQAVVKKNVSNTIFNQPTETPTHQYLNALQAQVHFVAHANLLRFAPASCGYIVGFSSRVGFRKQEIIRRKPPKSHDNMENPMVFVFLEISPKIFSLQMKHLDFQVQHPYPSMGWMDPLMWSTESMPDEVQKKVIPCGQVVYCNYKL